MKIYSDTRAQAGVIGIAVGIIIVVIGISIIASVVGPFHMIQSYTENQSFTIGNASWNQTNADFRCINATETIMNGSGNTMTRLVDYQFNASTGLVICAGPVTSAGTDCWGNEAETAYFRGCSYYDDSYIASDTTRTVISQIPVLAAVIGIVFVAGFLVASRR